MPKILVVDDDKLMLMITSRMLAKRYEIISALSGAEAVKLFESEKPDMVLSDLLMPEMDGYELHKILQTKSVEPVPVMFMTADERDESESKGFEVGAVDYIRKPFKADVLLRRVDNILMNLDKIHGLKQAADTDLMTGLLNKAASQREIGKMCSTQQGVLLMIDLDSFKLVNDLYGHNMGDKILIRFSELIKEVIRSSDLAGRMGGDEFIAFCQHIREEAVIIEKTTWLNAQLIKSAKEYMGADMNIPLGTSIGAVFVPDEGTDFSSLCHKADQALYKVKQNGKHGCAFFGSNNHKEETVSSQKGISQMRMILGERNREPGAYFLGLNDFKTIYRFLCRLVESYERDVQLMQITIETQTQSNIDEFRNTLLKTLRRSDCITQNGSNKFLLLLMEAGSKEREVIRDRILANWNKVNISAECKLKFEMENII
ncbi:MAG: diguanylate cyclase [Selenomonadaceae bacterium]|nr:diguanylate cyclase [Selenomonadaceae bacterium]